MPIRRLQPAVRRRALDRIYAQGCRLHGALDVTPEAFRAAASAAVGRRLDAAGHLLGAEDVRDPLARVDEAGLYLAVACDLGREGAWEVLVRTYRSRLVGVAVRRGVARSEAESLVDESLGALALPPPSGTARTRMGTYLGAGPLFAWLATILIRRIADRARGRRLRSLDAEPETSTPRPAAAQSEPRRAAESRESAERLADALSDVWTRLTARERLALTLQFRDGLTQRASARLLGVGQPRVSRVVGAALRKIRRAARSAVAGERGGAVDLDGAEWAGLRESLRIRLASLSADQRVPCEGTPRPRERHGT